MKKSKNFSHELRVRIYPPFTRSKLFRRFKDKECEKKVKLIIKGSSLVMRKVYGKENYRIFYEKEAKGHCIVCQGTEEVCKAEYKAIKKYEKRMRGLDYDWFYELKQLGGENN